MSGRTALFTTTAAMVAGCGSAGFDVAVHEQAPIDGLSVTALARGAEIRWDAAEGDEPLLVVLLPLSGTSAEARAIPVDPSLHPPMTVSGLQAGLEYTVQITTRAGRPVSPTARVLPFPSGALDPVPWYSATDDVPFGAFGAAVAIASDLDGDEMPDLAVGAPGLSNPELLEGAVYVYSGADYLAGLPVRFEPDVALGMFGAHLGSADDFDGDGYSDLLVNSPFPFPIEGTDTSGTPAGVVHVLLGGDGGALLGPAFPGSDNDLFGFSSLAKDLDGDLAAEIWAGSPGLDTVTVLSSGGVISFVAVSGSATRLGYSVAAGDYNDDGEIDLAVGEPLFGIPVDTGDPGEPVSGGTPGQLLRQGRVRVYYAIAPGVFDDVFDSLVSGSSGQMLGTALVTADVDGDGADDLLAGSSSCAIPGLGSPMVPGSISIWTGGSDGLTAAPQRVLSAGTICLGRNIGAGDVNDDGLVDVVGGDSSAGADGNGELRVFLGTTSGLLTAESSAIEGQPGSSLGSSLAVGDIDGDGRAEVFAGAPGTGDLAIGRVFLFRGAPRRGAEVTMGQSANGLIVDANGSFLPQEGPVVRYTCRWTWGDGEFDEADCQDDRTSDPTPHVYAEPGTYTVRFRVYPQLAPDRFGEAVRRVTVTAP
jgi:hypothetical protein